MYKKKKKKENFYNNFKKYKKIFHQLFNNISRYENDKYINKSYGGEKKRKEKTERRIFTITGRRDYPQKPRFYEKEVRLLPSILLLLLCPSGKKRRGSLELWRIQSPVEWWGDRFKRVLIGYIGRPRELSRSTKVHRCGRNIKARPQREKGFRAMLFLTCGCRPTILRIRCLYLYRLCTVRATWQSRREMSSRLFIFVSSLGGEKRVEFALVCLEEIIDHLLFPFLE